MASPALRATLPRRGRSKNSTAANAPAKGYRGSSNLVESVKRSQAVPPHFGQTPDWGIWSAAKPQEWQLRKTFLGPAKLGGTLNLSCRRSCERRRRRWRAASCCSEVLGRVLSVIVVKSCTSITTDPYGMFGLIAWRKPPKLPLAVTRSAPMTRLSMLLALGLLATLCGCSPGYVHTGEDGAVGPITPPSRWTLSGNMNDAALAGDGNLATVATGRTGQMSTLVVDLGSVCYFNMLVIDHGTGSEGAYPAKLAVETSMDGSNYVRRKVVAGSRRVTVVLLDQNTLARYIRISEAQAGGRRLFHRRGLRPVEPVSRLARAALRPENRDCSQENRDCFQCRLFETGSCPGFSIRGSRWPVSPQPEGDAVISAACCVTRRQRCQGIASFSFLACDTESLASRPRPSFEAGSCSGVVAAGVLCFAIVLAAREFWGEPSRKAVGHVRTSP